MMNDYLPFSSSLMVMANSHQEVVTIAVFGLSVTCPSSKQVSFEWFS